MDLAHSAVSEYAGEKQKEDHAEASPTLGKVYYIHRRHTILATRMGIHGVISRDTDTHSDALRGGIGGLKN